MRDGRRHLGWGPWGMAGAEGRTPGRMCVCARTRAVGAGGGFRSGPWGPLTCPAYTQFQSALNLKSSLIPLQVGS